MSESELQCQSCRRTATRLLVRSQLGGSDDRMYVCSSPACKPPGEWQDYGMDIETVANEWNKEHP